MDIKDGFASSSKEHLWSLVRVHELDESLPMVARTEVLRGTPPGIEAQKTELHARRTSILEVRMTSSKSCKWRGQSA
jgi:hypothetical protein